MANTFELIAATTVGSGGTSTISFTAIPQTYTHLLVKLSHRQTGAIAREVYVNPNGSASNGSGKMIVGNGATVTSYTVSRMEVSDYSVPSGATANTFGNVEFFIADYTSSNYKSASSDAVTENNGTTAYQMLHAALWSSTSAITSLDLVLAASDTFAQYSTAYLYGIKNS